MDIKKYADDLRTILNHIDFDKVNKVVDVLQEAHKNGNRVYVMGNGGSATTASHIAGDLNKTCGLKSMALTDSNYLITAWANDVAYVNIFRSQLENLIQPKDVVIGISGSGRSANVVYALVLARDMGCKTIGLTGSYLESNGGQVVKTAGISIVVPSGVMEQIEDIHLMIGHILVTELKNRSKT